MSKTMKKKNIVKALNFRKAFAKAALKNSSVQMTFSCKVHCEPGKSSWLAAAAMEKEFHIAIHLSCA